METKIEQFKDWLEKPEGLNLEFKKAENSFSESKDLPDYCGALANERGGKLILGVTNDRQIIGTKAFSGTLDKLSNKLLQNIKIRVDVEQLFFDGKRIVIFHVPSRPLGTIISSNGNYKYPMRAGSSLVEMTQEKIKEIHNETVSDFSTEIVPGLSLSDMDEYAISVFKNLWAKKQNNSDYLSFDSQKVLRSIEVLSDEGINYAGLILFGKSEKIKKLLPGAEIIFEWRQNNKIEHDFRKEWRKPFFSIFDDIWATINARNIRFPFQQGFIQREVYAFNEETVREAVLNAVTHRDYSLQTQSIFIKILPENFIIQSPGGFIKGINQDNILNKTAWRNRRIAEIFQLAGLVERAGQGIDKIFSHTIREGKGLPDFSNSDKYLVALSIPAKVKDEQFVLFLEKIINERQISLSFEEIYTLEKIRSNQKVKDIPSKDKFLELGIIEKIGKTSGQSYMLSHKYYLHEGKPGIHTRIVGISRDKKKELILQHIQKNKKGYISDFKDVFPELKDTDITNLLIELKKQKKIAHTGSRKTGYWIIAN